MIKISSPSRRVMLNSPLAQMELIWWKRNLKRRISMDLSPFAVRAFCAISESLPSQLNSEPKQLILQTQVLKNQVQLIWLLLKKISSLSLIAKPHNCIRLVMTLCLKCICPRTSRVKILGLARRLRSAKIKMERSVSQALTWNWLLVKSLAQSRTFLKTKQWLLDRAFLTLAEIMVNSCFYSCLQLHWPFGIFFTVFWCLRYSLSCNEHLIVL